MPISPKERDAPPSRLDRVLAWVSKDKRRNRDWMFAIGGSAYTLMVLAIAKYWF